MQLRLKGCSVDVSAGLRRKRAAQALTTAAMWLLASASPSSADVARRARADFVMGCAIGFGRNDQNSDVMQASLLDRLRQCRAIARRPENVDEISSASEKSRHYVAVSGCLKAQARLYSLANYQRVPPENELSSLREWCEHRLHRYR